jgi:hypothetical protein
MSLHRAPGVVAPFAQATRDFAEAAWLTARDTPCHELDKGAERPSN